MPGKTYSAGTIFLQVVPVFGDVQREIRRNVEGLEKDLGDDLEKAGRAAGKRGGKAMADEMGKSASKGAANAGTEFQRELDKAVRGMQDSLKPINLRFQSNDISREIKAVRGELEDLSKVKVQTELDAVKAKAEIKELATRLRALQKDAKLNAQLDIERALASAEAMEKRLDNLDKAAKIELELDRRQAERVLGAFERKVRESAKRAASSLGDSFDGETKKIRARLERLANVNIDVDMTAEEFLAEAKLVEDMCDKLDARSPKINVQTDARTAKAVLAEMRKDVLQLDEKTIVIEAEVEKPRMGTFEAAVRRAAQKASDSLGEPIDEELKRIQARLAALSDPEITPDFDGTAFNAELAAFEARLRELSAQSPNIQVQVDTGRAAAEIGALTALVKKVDGTDIDIQADVDAGAAIAKLSLLKRLVGGDSANAFRSFRLVILAVVAVLPALVPVIGAVGGALLALGPILASVGAGFGAMLVGFSGIGDAVSALGDVNKNAARDQAAAAKTMQAASYAVQDAQQAVADAARSAAQANADAARATAEARRSAADAIEDALERQKDAQEAYRDSVDEVRDAERDLRDARKRAAEEDAKSEQDLASRRENNALAIRQALLDAFDATNNRNAVFADGAASNYDREAADLAYDEAQQRLKDLRAEQAELADEKKEQDKNGGKGTEAVKDAQESLSEALEDQKDAQEALAEAAEAVTEARVNGARQIADAVRNQQRTEAAGARSVADAQEALRRANEAYGQALQETGEFGSESMRKLEEAMGKLSPAGRRFAEFLFGLRDEAKAFRDAIQEAMLPGVQRALETVISNYGPKFTAFMAGLGGVMGQFFEDFANALDKPAFTRFFDVMGELAPLMLKTFNDTFIVWMEIFASLLATAAPFAVAMGDAWLKMSEGLAGWLESEEGIDAVTGFLEYAARVGPEVLDFIGAFFRALGNLGEALAPLGEVFLNAFTGILDFIAEMDPDKLGLIAGALIGIVLAMQLATGVVAILAGGMAILASPIALVVFSIVALGILITLLAIKFPKFRKVLDQVADGIKRGFVWVLDNLVRPALEWIEENWPKILAKMKQAWETVLKPVLQAMGDFFVAFYEGVMKPAMKATVDIWTAAFDIMMEAWDQVLKPLIQDLIIPLIVFMWKRVFRPVLTALYKFWIKAFGFMKKAWNTVLHPVLRIILKVITFLAKRVFIPMLRIIVQTWIKVFRAMKFIWEKILLPVLNLIGDVIVKLWEKFVSPTLDLIKEGWDKMSSAMRTVWREVLKPIFDKFRTDVLPKLQTAFETVTGAIGKAWDKLKSLFAKPIIFVVDTIINGGLVAGFNKVANAVGSDAKIEPIKLPASFDEYRATGGVLPGYTPGKDVHHFTSPTGGRLHLSGGEAVMRPEWTAAVGTGFVDSMNAIARTKGARGVQAAMRGAGSYFLGGIIPLRGARSSQHTSGYSSAWAGDLNVGSGSDDYGMAVQAWKAGVIAGMHFNGSGANNPNGSYGRWMDINHAGGVYSRYAHLSAFANGLAPGQPIGAGATLGYVGSIGNSSAPHLHFELNGGSQGVDLSDLGGIGKSAGTPSFPKWLIQVAKNPLGYLGGLISKPVDALRDKFGGNAFVQMIGDVPKMLFGGIKDKIIDLIPGPLKTLAGVNKKAEIKSDGDEFAGVGGDGDGGFAKGGVIGYNGTMKYDRGGYLPPGLTSVVNLTGKPEPVFTAEQFAGLGVGAQRGGGGAKLEPHFHNYEPRDALEELEFLMRKFNRSGGGKYEGLTS